jgi:dipeptidyl aminopeptidase/acylaminoacyl peptidase
MRVRAEVPDMASHVPLESGRNSFLMFEPVLYAARIRTPCLAIRGDVDEIVPMGKSERLICEISSIKELSVIKHGPHPLPMSDKASEVFALTLDWFDRYMV